MSEAADATLLARFQAGDDQALTELLIRYEGPLFQFLLGMLHDHHQAEDVLQETVIRALERLDGVNPDHLRGWLFTVAYHQAMLAKRRQKSRPAYALAESIEVPTPQPGPFQQAEQQDDLARLHYLLEQLPAAQQEVIRRRIYGGQRFKEIAEDLNCPLNTALARMHEGLKRLRSLWENDNVRR
jgi:RNA polymerase sigma-70 factor (ECF subfamily)